MNQRHPTILTEHLRDKQLLLILDNCEHLLAACAAFADTALHAAPRAKVLASSREALGIASEATYHVPSLPCPNPTNHMPAMELAKYDAVRLFVERALAAKSNFTLSDANAKAVAQVCFRLDGIPLAIELVAARIKVFRPSRLPRGSTTAFGCSRAAAEPRCRASRRCAR